MYFISDCLNWCPLYSSFTEFRVRSRSYEVQYRQPYFISNSGLIQRTGPTRGKKQGTNFLGFEIDLKDIWSIGFQRSEVQSNILNL